MIKGNNIMIKYRAFWDAGYGCTCSMLLAGLWDNEEEALAYARFVIGGHVLGVEPVYEKSLEWIL
jgi:hypothetical protein